MRLVKKSIVFAILFLFPLIFIAGCSDSNGRNPMDDIIGVGDDPTGDDPTGDDPTGDDPTGDDPTGDDPSDDDPSDDEGGDDPGDPLLD